MPPFRTYLVLSIVFFLVAFFDPREEFELLFEPAAESSGEAEDAGRTAAETREDALKKLADEGIIASDEIPPEDPHEGGAGDVNFDLSTGEGEVDCDVEELKSADIPKWLSRRITPERLQIMCERVSADDGRALLDKMRDNVPAALFVLLPLMALVLKLIYPLSKRYYVEHLLFVLHYHAFFFLILILQILFARFVTLVRIPESVGDIVLIGASIYIPAYLFRSMQRVYGQGAFITSLKFIFLAIAYFVGFGMMIGFAALFAAFSI